MEDPQHYSDRISQSVIMNIQAEFDNMVHNMMTGHQRHHDHGKRVIPQHWIPQRAPLSDFTLFVCANPTDRLIYNIGKDEGGQC